MYLKQLELSGFKSFAKKTTLEFPRGITAIVGPNGSGKSNIVDAIRWVLAEQSFKNLRGKKGDDLIFHGTSSRKRLGQASASLHLADAAEHTPDDLDEVVVTRKVSRGGEGTYLLNGRSVRLADLEVFLSRSGIGAGSFRVLSQGMSDSLITLGPAELKSFVDDAAGVKEYQHKKRRAVRRIRSCRDNLERVSALLEELAPRVRSLKRQNNKLARRAEVEARLREVAIALFSARYHRIIKKERTIAQKKKESESRMATLERTSEKLKEKLTSHTTKREDEALRAIDTKIRSTEEKEHDLSKQIARLEGTITAEKERVKRGTRISPHMITAELEALIQAAEQGSASGEHASVLQHVADTLKKLLKRISGEEDTQQDTSHIAELEEKHKAYTAEREAVSKERHAYIQERDEVYNTFSKEREELVAAEKEWREHSESLSRLRDEVNRLTVEEEKLTVRREQLHDTLQQIDVVTLAEVTKHESEEDVDEEAYEKELWKLKRESDRIGEIDPAVSEEYRGVSDRYEFLKKESDDLNETLASLTTLVRDLEEDIQKRFSDTLTKVSEGFNQYFRLMFDGGAAHLENIALSSRTTTTKNTESDTEDNDDDDNDEDELAEDDGSTEDGIAIRVNLPTKKVRRLGMLSGGERALVSIALLFSLVTVRKPPFLVLDEIDAALDEVNSARFIRLVQELSHETQFVIITHNRVTMSEADALYGISMKDGISHILSLKLEQEEEQSVR